MKNIFITYLIFAAVLIAQENSLQQKYQLAHEYQAANDLQKAMEIYEDILKQEPDNLLFFNDLHELYIRLGEYDKAISSINILLKKRPDDIDLHGKLGDTYFKMGKREDAFAIWNNAVKLPANNAMSYRIISNYLMQNRAFDEAIEMLKRGRETAGMNDLYTFDIAQLYTITMQFEDAANEYCHLLLQQPQQLSGVQSRITAYLDRQVAAEQFISGIKLFYEDHRETVIASLLSYLYKRTNDFPKAYEIDSELDKLTNANGQLIFAFANEAFNNKAYSSSSKAYKQIIDEIKNLNLLPNSYLGYVKSKEMELGIISSGKFNWEFSSVTDTSMYDDYRELISEYEKIGKLFMRPDISAEVNYRIGYIYFHRFGNQKTAQNYFELSTSEINNGPFALLSKEELVKIFIQKDDLTEALVLLKDLLKQSNLILTNKNRYQLELARIYFWQNKFEESMKILSDLTGNTDDDAANDGIELSLIINSANKDSVSLSKIAYADLLSWQKKYPEASGIFKEIFETPDLFFLNEYAGLKYVEMLLMENNIPLATSVLEKITTDEMPGIFKDKAVFLLGEIYQFAVMDIGKAKRIYERLLEEFPFSIYLERARENLLYINSKERNNS